MVWQACGQCCQILACSLKFFIKFFVNSTSHYHKQRMCSNLRVNVLDCVSRSSSPGQVLG